MSSYGLHQHVVGPTHTTGGTLDVVFTRADLPFSSVDVIDVCFSDHHLLQWISDLLRPSPVYATDLVDHGDSPI
jgi:hypothetical protein